MTHTSHTARRLARAAWLVLTGLCLTLPGAPARADVASPAPLLCPPGSRGQSGHSPHCAPHPLRDCPGGYTPEVRHNVAYCQAPPSTPCPLGSSWQSFSESEARCVAGSPCTGTCSYGGPACAQVSLCLRPFQYGWRGGQGEEALGTCTTDADCAAIKDARCVTQSRCHDPAEPARLAAAIASARASGPPPIPRRAQPMVMGPHACRCATASAGALELVTLLLSALALRRRVRR